MRRWCRPVAVMLVAVCLLVAGCVSEWDRGMQALKADPMASATWDGLELISAEGTTNEGHKPPGPSITRCYKLTIPVDEAFSRVLETAEEHGWVEDVSVRSIEDVVATKQLNNSNAAVIFSTREVDCFSNPAVNFRITIHYQ